MIDSATEKIKGGVYIFTWLDTFVFSTGFPEEVMRMIFKSKRMHLIILFETAAIKAAALNTRST